MSSPDAGPHLERLPGIGSSLELTDADGRRLRAVRLHDGSVELFAEPTNGSVSLDPPSARSLGAFVGGHYLLRPDVSERIDHVLGGLVVDWIQLGADDHAVGRTIGELQVRRRTGVTVVAVLRGPTAVVAPEPDLRFERGDELVFACGRQDRDDFERFLQTGR